MKIQARILGLLVALLLVPIASANEPVAPLADEPPVTAAASDAAAGAAVDAKTGAELIPLPGAAGEEAGLSELAAEQETAAGLPHDLSPWGMYLAADWVVKSVMIGLLLASVLTWAIWIFKALQLHVARHRARSILQILVNAESFADARQYCAEQRGVGVDLLGATAHELQLSAQGPASDDGIK